MAQLPLSGRHALVTGAGRGIGAAIAGALASLGAGVTLLGRSRAPLESVAAALPAGTRCGLVGCDVTAEAEVRRAFEEARRALGAVHILVNNAGQAPSAPFTKTDPALWNATLAVNLTGAYLCTRAAVPDMLAAGFGRIVNVASTAGLAGHAYISAYCAAKHGLIGLTRALAQEYATRNITVNAVCPGYTDTEMVQSAIENIRTKTGRSAEQALGALTARNPQGRLITPQEVAHTVAWLCGPGTESITGQSIVIAGGELT